VFILLLENQHWVGSRNWHLHKINKKLVRSTGGAQQNQQKLVNWRSS